MANTTNTPASATSVMTGLVGLVEQAMGSAESEKTKTRLHLAATILGGIAEEGASLLADKFDTAAILSGIQRVENGLADVEGGVEDVLAAVKVKKATTTTTTAQVSSAA